MAAHALLLNQSMVSQQKHSLNRESLAEKRLSQIFPVSDAGVRRFNTSIV